MIFGDYFTLCESAAQTVRGEIEGALAELDDTVRRAEKHADGMDLHHDDDLKSYDADASVALRQCGRNALDALHEAIRVVQELTYM